MKPENTVSLYQKRTTVIFRLPLVLHFLQEKQNTSRAPSWSTDAAVLLERKAEDEEIISGEEWETPCRRSWAEAQRSTPVPAGPIPTRITTGPVHNRLLGLTSPLSSFIHRPCPPPTHLLLWRPPHPPSTARGWSALLTNLSPRRHR